MPKEVILDWEEYQHLQIAKDIHTKLVECSSVAINLYNKNLITKENAQAYLMPILRVLSEE